MELLGKGLSQAISQRFSHDVAEVVVHLQGRSRELGGGCHDVTLGLQLDKQAL